MYQHYARPGPGVECELPGHAVAILSVQGSSPGVQIVDVNTDYQRLWGGSREGWLGMAPIIVQQEVTNRQIFDQLHDALNPLMNDAGNDFEGLWWFGSKPPS